MQLALGSDIITDANRYSSFTESLLNLNYTEVNYQIAALLEKHKPELIVTPSQGLQRKSNSLNIQSV